MKIVYVFIDLPVVVATVIVVVIVVVASVGYK